MFDLLLYEEVLLDDLVVSLPHSDNGGATGFQGGGLSLLAVQA
jgi:hypothetical protein